MSYQNSILCDFAKKVFYNRAAPHIDGEVTIFKGRQYTIIDFNFGRHKDLSTRKSDIHRGRKAEVNITFEGR